MHRRSMLLALLGVTGALALDAVPALAATKKKKKAPKAAPRRRRYRGQTAPRELPTQTPNEKAPVNR